MLAVVGGKGGCGKTTTALAVARALARDGRDPLVVGADVDAADLHRLADVPPDPSFDALEGRPATRVVRRPTAFPGVAVLPAGSRGRLGSALSRVQAWPGPVLVDCPPGCGEAVATSLRRCGRSLLVTTDRPQSLEDARKTDRLAGRLDTPSTGTVVRVTERSDSDGSDRAVPGSVVARVPDAAEPLSDPRVATAYASAAETLSDRWPIE